MATSDGAIDVPKQLSYLKRRRSMRYTREPSTVGERAPLVAGGERERHWASCAPGDAAYIWREMIVGKSLNALMVFLPFGLLAALRDWHPVLVFGLNFLALVPVASLLGDFTEELAVHAGETIGGLINATFGNAVEMVITVQALHRGELQIVQDSLLGSIFSNALLVLGCALFASGSRHGFRAVPRFSGEAAVANTSLLLMSALAMVLPTQFVSQVTPEETASDENTLVVSRISAVVMLLIYALLLLFQLGTHRSSFASDEDEDEDPDVSAGAALLGLGSCTVVVSVFSDFVVGSLADFSESTDLSKRFVSVVMLPVVGNAVEHVAAIGVALSGKTELAMGIALGSATQVAAFVVPFAIAVGWMLGRPMTFLLPEHEFTTYIVTLIFVGHLTSGGYSNWLEGAALVATYVLISIAYFFAPHTPE